LFMMSSAVCFLCGDLSAATGCIGEDCSVSVCCIAAHLAVHRPDGLDRCLPFKVEDGGKDVGHYLVATRDIAAGDIVVLDKAGVVAPNDTPGTTEKSCQMVKTKITVLPNFVFCCS
jgi:hypothetical protein